MKDINRILGERIKLVRKAKNMTREKLAELIDVSPRFLAEVEAGKVGVSLQKLKNISTILTISTDYLIGLVNDELKQTDILFNQITRINEKYYPLISKILDEISNIE